MRVAIFHNYMDNIGGAEIVGLTLARELNAPIYTTNIDRDKINKMGFSDIDIRSIGKVPVNAPLRQQIALFRFRFFKPKEEYDAIIIDGDWAMSGGVRNKNVLWYVHSPIREIWDLHTYVRETMVKFYKRPLFDLWVIYNRYLNRKYANHIDYFVCNSRNTQMRLEKYLGKKSEVIHPPIDTDEYTYKESKGYWLSVNRLLDHKRVDMQMKAFKDMPDERLVIVGSYEKSDHFKEYVERMEKLRPNNVKIVSWVDKKELKKLYSECIGFITTAKDEDFGMTPVEAMASGKPVIAANEGGYKETVLQGKTGILIDDINAGKLILAVKKIGPRAASYRQSCEARAAEFDTNKFIFKITEVLREMKK